MLCTQMPSKIPAIWAAQRTVESVYIKRSFVCRANRTVLPSIFDTALSCQCHGGSVYLLIGHAWSSCAPNPSVTWQNKRTNRHKRWRPASASYCHRRRIALGLIYSVMEAADCDMALLRTVAASSPLATHRCPLRATVGAGAIKTLKNSFTHEALLKPRSIIFQFKNLK